MGFVSLVGAGPGDPGLLTRRAVARLRAADLVLFDALVDDRVLRIARRARRFYVGKRAGRHAMAQETIAALMIRAARRGLRVVRLKGGDPFVFGRGGEEALALRAAGIGFDVVPGVTSATAAAAAAGVPVTHRGLASGFAVVSGHDAQTLIATAGAMPPQALTLVVLMGIGRRASLADLLIARGWRPDTPAAIVSAAWSDRTATWRGSLGDLGAAPVDARDPGTIIVGEVASLDLRAEAFALGAGLQERSGEYVSRR